MPLPGRYEVCTTAFLRTEVSNPSDRRGPSSHLVHPTCNNVRHAHPSSLGTLHAAQQPFQALPASRPNSSCAEREPNTFFVFLGAGSAQAIVTSPDNAPAGTLSDALINDPGSTAARHAPASSYHGKTRSMVQSSAHGSDEWEAHLTSEPPISRVVQHDLFNDESGREPRECR